GRSGRHCRRGRRGDDGDRVCVIRMAPILFRIGTYTVYTYTVMLALGMLAGTWVSYSLSRRRFSNPQIALDAGFWGLLGGVLGGRLGYVISNWAYFVDHLDKAIAIWNGGLSWHGALIGGVAAVLVWWVAARRNSPSLPGWRDLLDVIAPGLALGGAFGWLGCLLTGSAYGAEASGYLPPVAWFTADLPDIYGVWEVRFITQPLMIAWSVLLFILLFTLHRRFSHSPTFALYLLLYALADFGVMFLRGDGAWRLWLWLGQWVALVETGAGLTLLVSAGRRSYMDRLVQNKEK
ncbi:MAG: prolipoprotein diacylglyceryl transferase, partial [Anaerolineae bacterium]|nr:prolipoprotein diacylglyceryl transferase [Anaerolineae bacterium]